VPAPYTEPKAHELRRRYLDAFGGDEFPVPVESVAEDLLGLAVERAPLTDCSGMLLPLERVIVVNGAEPETRRRFTIAHELGHWICQCIEGIAEPVMCRDNDLSTATNRAREREANVFAAELLMPEAAIRHAGDAAAAAIALGVSPEAAQWRFYSFDLGPAPALRGDGG
jgi:Zn-dependent peptidase ImmA (M78 family)